MEAVPRTFFQHFSQHSPTCVRFSFMSHLVMTAFHGPFFFHPFSSFSSRQSIGGKFHSRLPCPGKTTLSQTRTAFFRFPDAGHSLSEYMPAVTKHLPHVTTKNRTAHTVLSESIGIQEAFGLPLFRPCNHGFQTYIMHCRKEFILHRWVCFL